MISEIIISVYNNDCQYNRDRYLHPDVKYLVHVNIHDVTIANDLELELEVDEAGKPIKISYPDTVYALYPELQGLKIRDILRNILDVFSETFELWDQTDEEPYETEEYGQLRTNSIHDMLDLRHHTKLLNFYEYQPGGVGYKHASASFRKKSGK